METVLKINLELNEEEIFSISNFAYNIISLDLDVIHTELGGEVLCTASVVFLGRLALKTFLYRGRGVTRNEA